MTEADGMAFVVDDDAVARSSAYVHQSVKRRCPGYIALNSSPNAP